MAFSATSLSSFSSLSIRTTRFSVLNQHPLPNNLTPKSKASKPFPVFPFKLTSTTKLKAADSETTFFEDPSLQEEVVFEPTPPPEGFVPPPSFDDGPMETEDEIAAAYEEIYGPAYRFGSKVKKEKVRDGFEERVVQVRRVTKVVKGGKQLHFRAVVVVGDKQGQVGVGVGKAKEVIAAVQKSATNARRNIITVPMTKYLTFPHRYCIFCSVLLVDLMLEL
ncbi:30S ribosomal protein S5, chloroplastic [Vitis vinifera]|uniref:30S ribosomal protein S5, chloroplastic n=1 Tax=Vitis vinifera TaxID=29760 RepID=A0A438DR38_VITVI|nr:30S ribosomal protein S5, chloroplastic [Vitis vinifera]